MDKVEKTPAQLMEVALRMQGISVSVGIMEQIIETYIIFRRKRGKFSLSDACQLQYKYEQNYPKPQPENASEEKQQENQLPVLPQQGDIGTIYLEPGEKRLVEIEAKEFIAVNEKDLQERCQRCCLLHTAYCLQMACGGFAGELREKAHNCPGQKQVYYQIVRP